MREEREKDKKRVNKGDEPDNMPGLATKRGQGRSERKKTSIDREDKEA